MSLPSKPVKGAPISADAVARLVEETRARSLKVLGIGLAKNGKSGVAVSPLPAGLRPASRRGLVLHPFKVTNASEPSPAAAKVRVRFGQVNSITPTLGGVALDNPAVGKLTVVSGVVYLEVTTDANGIVTAATIGNAAALPTDTATTGHLTLATVTVVSDAVTAINQSVTHSLQHRRCGVDDHHFWAV